MSKSHENTSKYVDTVTFCQNLEPKVIDPQMTFDPKSVEFTCVTLPKDHCVQVPWKYIKVCGYSDLFFKNLNQRSLTPKWPLTPNLLRSHVWLYPRIIVSKSHGNTSMYVDTMINFAKYHILHIYRTHTTYILRTEWVITKSLSEHSSGKTKMGDTHYVKGKRVCAMQMGRFFAFVFKHKLK